MNNLTWLVGLRFGSITRRDHDWVFAFDGGVRAVVACLWRLVEASRVRLTNQDDGHQFGLPAPLDAVAEVNHRLFGATIEAVGLRGTLLDLELQFSNGHLLQFIPDSAGYEAWSVLGRNCEFIAVGGGELVIFGDPPLS